MNLPQETLDAVLEDWQTADIPQRTRAALRLLETMTLHPADIDQAFVQSLNDAGLDTIAIQEAANVGFHYNLINRVADAINFPVPSGVQTKRLASILNITGKLLKGSRAEKDWVLGEDDRIRPPEVELGRERILTKEGATSLSLRRSVEAFVLAQWGVERSNAEPVPNELETYLKKLSLHAYKVTDAYFEAMREQGFTDEELYEITIVGSIGAALVGLEKLYEALYRGEGSLQ